MEKDYLVLKGVLCLLRALFGDGVSEMRPAPGVGRCALVQRLRCVLVRRLWCFDLRRTGRAEPTCCQPDNGAASAFRVQRADVQGPVRSWRRNVCQSVGLL